MLNFNTVTIYGFIFTTSRNQGKLCWYGFWIVQITKAIIYWNVLIGEKYISYIWTFIKGG